MNREGTVPELLVERLAAGDLSAEQAREVERRLAREPDGAARLEALAREDEAILERYPARVQAAAIRERAVREAGSRRRRLLLTVGPALAAAAAALLIFVVFPFGAEGPKTIEGPGVRLKGGPLLSIYRREDRSARQLAAGTAVSAGDRLQIAYTAGDARHGVILSLDGRGVVTLHYPSTPDGSTALEPDGAHVLNYSYELDDAPGFERFFFVTAERPIDVRRVTAAARALKGRARARLVLNGKLSSGGLSVKELLLPKLPRAAPEEVPR